MHYLVKNLSDKDVVFTTISDFGEQSEHKIHAGETWPHVTDHGLETLFDCIDPEIMEQLELSR